MNSNTNNPNKHKQWALEVLSEAMTDINKSYSLEIIERIYNISLEDAGKSEASRKLEDLIDEYLSTKNALD